MTTHHSSIPPTATVLLVDDQPIVGEVVGRVLECEPDIRLHVCTDANEAVAMACRINPTVILQDLIMPGVDGLDLVRAYRSHADTANVPVVVLSTKALPTIKNAAFLAGANDYLVKLPDPIELIARIRYHSNSYVHRRQRNDALDFLSHDMRVPQNAILTLLDMYRLEYGELPPILGRVAAHARTALKLAEGFTYLARAQAESHQFEIVDLCDLLVIAVDQMWEKSVAMGCRIIVDAPEAPLKYFADPLLLTRLALNLIDNALKYGPRDSEARCILSRTENGVLLGVEDAGAGIPMRDIDRAAERFVRLPADAMNWVDGFGLGLTFVNVVANKHRGRVIMDRTLRGFRIGVLFPEDDQVSRHLAD
ncbi:hybrid sensor histidine kinase/response regulator [Paraburkholderia bryophila]|uniref:histidine kinase n=1 Tax=Paraburkholderia bryophila TaxID=420952 RepID=A0A7Y9WT26_9BURK|nr:hybrid sensor histidine kinase/response regulator [Paraburkholderia bryophila]NYH25845.1 signal transduction histidine kinase [Paraburkholderia bryophila]